MILLAIKTGKKYIQQKDNKIITCEMNKASVFPIDQKQKAETIVTQAKQAGFPDATLYKLTITEKLA